MTTIPSLPTHSKGRRLLKRMLHPRPIRLPPELSSVTDVHISEKYKWLADKYAETIQGLFDRKTHCQFTSGGTRQELIDLSFIADDIATIAAGYKADVYELSIFRLLETKRDSDRGKKEPTSSGWVSELWHSDNHPPDSFKIIVYLSDVGELQSPFEYKYPVEYVPWNPKLGWQDTRYPYECNATKVTLPPIPITSVISVEKKGFRSCGSS